MKATNRFSSPARRLAGVLVSMLLCGAMCLAQAPPPSHPLTVVDVVPEGLRLVPAQRVMSQIKTRPGGEYDKEKLNEDVRTLYKTNQFANITVYDQPTADGRGVILHFVFREFPSGVQEIVYHGAGHCSPDELNTIVAVTGLRKGVPLNPTMNQMARQAILDHYKEDGRLLASVDLAEGGNRGDTRVVFNITEGPVVRVSKIEFTGNTFVTGSRLNTQIDSSHMFLQLVGGIFKPAMADHDIEKLEEYYRFFGYHDVRVSRELQWEEDHRRVRLIFHIHEGPRYRVAGVDIEGEKTFDRDRLLSLTKVKTGEYYSNSDSKGSINNITNMYGYHGYWATVSEQFTYPPDKPGEVLVSYEIKERPPARVGEIIIIGNDVTRENVIRRQVPLYPGQVLTYPDQKVAEANLARLGIFEVNQEQGIRPTVTVLDPESDSEFKNILVQVQETRTGSLMFGVGVNSDAGLTGSIVLNERNFDILNWPTSVDDLLSGHAFRGAGQEFRIEAVPGTQLQRYTVSWREPYLFDSLYSFGVSGYYYDRVYNEYTESRLGVRFTLGRKFGRYWTISAGLRIEDVGVNSVPYYAPVDFTSVQGSNFLIAPKISATFDSRDSYLRATQGMMIEGGVELVTGEFTFPVVTLSADKYWTIYQRADGSGRQVLAAHSEASWAGSNAPVYERFYAGGFRSMRGFEFRGVGPEVDGFKVGGDFMWLNSLEYQVPVRANDQLYLVAFVDSGTVESSVEIKNYRVTAGAGIRITVPMLGPVPIALDFGFPIVQASFDNKQVFSFWVGFFR